MIGFVQGEIVSVSADEVLIEAGGIGYNIMITAQTASLLPSAGESIRIYTYLSVREDAMKLYGFLTKDELDLFKLLICVNGIGPKGAMGILAVMDTDTVRMAILSGDAKTIGKCPGVGPKTAQRIILDLKDKIAVEDVLTSATQTVAAGNLSKTDNAVKNEAIEALVALGFSATEALRAVKKVDASGLDSSAVISEALKYMN